MKTSLKVRKPSFIFDVLSQMEYSLEEIKEQYVRAVFYNTGSISKTAKICGIHYNTVSAFCGRDYPSRYKEKLTRRKKA